MDHLVSLATKPLSFGKIDARLERRTRREAHDTPDRLTPPDLKARLEAEGSGLGPETADYARKLIEENLPAPNQLTFSTLQEMGGDRRDARLGGDRTAELRSGRVHAEPGSESDQDGGAERTNALAMRRLLLPASTPLGLLVQRVGVKPADECRCWLTGHFTISPHP